MRNFVSIIVTVLTLTSAPICAEAFCGFYVSGATNDIYNNATQVVMMREGTRTVLSMQNNYEGPPEDFAMVIPVPVVLQQNNVKTLDPAVFDRVDQMAAPRLVEYWEEDPCQAIGTADFSVSPASGAFGTGERGGASADGNSVVVEAQFKVEEYEIVILSAKDSGGLDAWLRAHHYNIPAGAEPVLRPYVEAGTKFFVAKVDVTKVKFDGNRALLSPLRFYYDTPDFTLPVRLGLLNSRGHQDVIVHILARNQRYQVANYRNTTIPTNLMVDNDVRDQFGEFYAALFDETVAQNPGAVVTEYSWNARTCDPCPGPRLTSQDFMSLGADVAFPPAVAVPTSGRFTRRRTTVTGGLDKQTVERRLRSPSIRYCYDREVRRDPDLRGRVKTKFTISKAGRVKDLQIRKNFKTPAVAQCMERQLRRIRYPISAAPTRVSHTFTIAPGPAVRRSSVPRDFVLTRLHARYTKETLGEDLVFEAADPLFGGRGTPNKMGELSEKGGTTSSDVRTNQFQGRYVILHPWEGALECQEPSRGLWDGRSSRAQAARDLADAPRGNVALPTLVRQDVPSLKLKTRNAILPLQSLKKGAPPAEAAPEEVPPETDQGPGPPAATQSPDAVPDSKASGGCGCQLSAGRIAPWFVPWRR
jgi:hypothetical protein